MLKRDGGTGGPRAMAGNHGRYPRATCAERIGIIKPRETAVVTVAGKDPARSDDISEGSRADLDLQHAAIPR